MQRKQFLLTALLVSSVVLLAAPAGAQNIIRNDCLPYIAAASKLTYDGGDHRKWYRHYWEGKCEGFWPWECTTSQKGWNARMNELLNTAATPQQKQRVLQLACKQGELIGYEWAKDNNKRCLQTERSQDPVKNLELLREILQNTGLTPLDRLKATGAKFREWCPNVTSPHSRP